MAGLQDMMARAAAAQGGMQEVPPEMGGMAPEEAVDVGGPVDLETALDGVEQALVGLGEDVVSEIRIHLNAIRDIASQGGGVASEEVAPEQAPPVPETGMAG